jgi:hypothetical protein
MWYSFRPPKLPDVRAPLPTTFDKTPLLHCSSSIAVATRRNSYSVRFAVAAFDGDQEKIALRRQCSLRRKCKQKALFVIPSASPIACLPASQSLSSLQSATHSVLRRRYSICSNKRASPTQSIQSKLNWRGTQRSKYFSTRCEEIAVPQSIFMPIHVCICHEVNLLICRLSHAEFC